MSRNLAFVVGSAALLVSFTVASVSAAQFGTAEEAKAMLERAVAAVKEDKAKAIDMFNKGEGGFKDRDLYVFCANASDGIVTAHPYGQRGKLREMTLTAQRPRRPSLPWDRVSRKSTDQDTAIVSADIHSEFLFRRAW